MAIETRIVRGLLTEIYINGGGNFITQAAPTNFHGFWPSKVMSAGESVDDFMEVTPAQKAALEKADAAWVAPGEELIAEAKAAGAVYNSGTGYFELNGLVDITAEQMRKIILFGKFPIMSGHGIQLGIRTNINVRNSSPYVQQSIRCAVLSCKELEVIDVTGCCRNISDVYQFIHSCPMLRKVIGYIQFVAGANANTSFVGLERLEEIEVRTSVSLSFKDSPLLSLASIQYMVAYAANTTAITITLHADAYARVTDELFSQAAQRQITFACA